MKKSDIERLERVVIGNFGIASTSLARIVASEYELITQLDLQSSDDFSDLSSEDNKPIRWLMFSLGYQYTSVGWCMTSRNNSEYDISVNRKM